MLNKKMFRNLSALGVIFLLFSAGLDAAGGQAAGQPSQAKRRTAPIYATGKDGAPAAGLTSADLEVKLGGNPVENFALAKGGSEHKLFFLVFDTASMSSNLLSKSKKIAESVVSPADARVRFVVMSIDPGVGLRFICGPTTDKAFVTKTIGKSITAKSGSYFQSRSTDGSGILDELPDYRHKMANSVLTKQGKEIDRTQDKQVGTVIISSLRTLNSVLTRFPESDKVVLLYSSGIPQGATQDKASINFGDQGGLGQNQVDNAAPDRMTYDLIKSSGQAFRKNGSLLFVVNPGGMRIGEENDASGEQSLHMLVNESNGRYFEGSDKSIIESLSTIEQGYYELSLPSLPEIQGAGIELEVRAKSPDITLSSAGAIARTRRFAEMTPADKQSVILNILNNGLVGDIGLSVSPVQVEATGSDEETILTVQLPAGLSQAEWDIYKVWRDTGKGGFQVEKEHVLSESPMLTFSMAVKENTFQDAVLVHAKSGTVLVCQGKGKPKS